MLGVDGVKSFAPVGRLDQPVPLMAEQRYEEFPVGREVVNDQDVRDAQFSRNPKAEEAVGADRSRSA